VDEEFKILRLSLDEKQLNLKSTSQCIQHHTLPIIMKYNTK